MDQDLTDLLNRMEPKLRKDFLRMYAKTLKGVSVTQVEALISSGRIDEAIALVTTSSASFGATWIVAYITAATEAGQWITAQVGVEVVFDQVNQRAVNAMQNNRLRLVQNLTQAQRDATRESLLDGIRRGINPRQSAIAVRDSIGLTAYQVRAVNNYRRMLEEGDATALTRALRDKRFDAAYRRAMNTGAGLSEDQITKMVNAYRKRQLAYRAEVISRTEALRSVHEGTEAMFEQAIADGFITPEELIRTWNTAMDTRVRDTHTTMNQQKQPYGTPFVSGAGNLLRFPGDPLAPVAEVANCRCALGTRLIARTSATIEIR